MENRSRIELTTKSKKLSKFLLDKEKARKHIHLESTNHLNN